MVSLRMCQREEEACEKVDESSWKDLSLQDVSQLQEFLFLVNGGACTNYAQLVGTEDDTSYVPVEDWQAYLSPFYKPLQGLPALLIGCLTSWQSPHGLEPGQCDGPQFTYARIRQNASLKQVSSAPTSMTRHLYRGTTSA